MKMSQTKAQKIAEKIADEYMNEMESRKKINVRINNIEFRTTGKSKGEIIQWLPNHYYGKLSDYLESGEWSESGGNCIVSKGGSIDKNLFKNEQYCIVVAWLQYEEANECCDMSTVGPRVLNLSQEERDTFFEVYELADRKLTKQSKEYDREY